MLAVTHIALLPDALKLLESRDQPRAAVVWRQPPLKLIYPETLVFLTHFLLIPSLTRCVSCRVDPLPCCTLSQASVFCFFSEPCANNHFNTQHRESSATSVLLEEVDFASFLFLTNFLYFHVVSGNTFFFFFLFICLGAKVSVPGGRETVPAGQLT